MIKATLVAVSVLSAGVAGAQSDGTALHAKFVKTLNSAQSLSVSCTILRAPASPLTYKLELAKPNLFKIDTADRLIVGDGANITILNKRLKVYYSRKQTDAEQEHFLNKGEYVLWAGFFDSSFASKAQKLRSVGTKERKGATYDVVAFELAEGPVSTMACYFDQKDGIARSAEFTVNAGRIARKFQLDAPTVTLADKADRSRFAFSAPEGTRELTEAELAAWYGNVDTALQAAKNTDRMLMIVLGSET